MSSILFAMAVVAFLIVVYWAFVNERLGRKARGLLDMRDADDPEATPRRSPPRWARGGPHEAPSEQPVSRSQPRWRRAAQLGRWRS